MPGSPFWKRSLSLMMANSEADHPRLAASLMVSALFILAFQDALVKLVSDETSLWQFQLIRAGLNLLMLALLARQLYGSNPPWPKRFWAVSLRSILLVSAMGLYFGSMPFLSLPEIAAGLYVFPLFVAVLSRLLLGERLGQARVIAVLTGFAGTLLILKPGTEAFRLIGLMPLLAGLCYAGTVLVTRRLCRDESPITLTFGVNVAFMLLGAVMTLVLTLQPLSAAPELGYLATGWRPLDLFLIAIIVLCAVLNLISNVTLAKAYQSAEVSWLAPFDYSFLVFTTFWSWVLFSSVPDAWTFVGMALIAVGGMLVAHSARRSGATP